MGLLLQSFKSSIGKKILMAITGTLLMLFLMVHVAGNITLFIGEETFTAYVETLSLFKPLIRVIEVILALVFLFHIFYGTKLWIENKMAKPKKYAVNAGAKSSNVFSRTTFLTGSIIFIFLVVHLQTLWYVFNFSGEELSLYKMVVGWFQVPWYSVFYIIAMGLLGYHLNHGFESAFQTFGWNNNRFFPVVKAIGLIYSIIVAALFASMPIYFLFFYGGNL